MRTKFLLTMFLAIGSAVAAEPTWYGVNGGAATRVTGHGDVLGGDGAELDIETGGMDGAIGTVDATALRGHEVELSARMATTGNTRAMLWLRADGAERGLAFINGANAPLDAADGEQPRSLRLYVPLASTAIRLGAMNLAAGSTSVHGLRLRALPDAATAVHARAVLDAMLDAAQENALGADRVDWPALRARLSTPELASQPPGEAYARFREIVAALGDRHSFAMPPSATTDYRGSGRPVGALHSWSRDDVGYVAVPGFMGTDEASGNRFARELCATLSALAPRARHGYIVDLRGNGGGNMWPMVAGLQPLFGTGRPGAFRHGDGHATPWIVERPAGCRRDAHAARVAVLIGPQTASSGEAVAIALHGPARHRFFGSASAGLSTSNEPYPLPDGGSAWLTTAVDVDRDGRAYPSGIEPDEATPPGDATVDAAMRWLTSAQ